MGPSPTIPTSFVPKQPVHSAARYQKSGGNIFLVIGVFMFVLALVGAAGVFAYSKYLDGVLASKEAQLAATEASVNAGAVEDFIRFRDRFASAGELLDNHIAASGFFDLLERLTLANVRFTSLAFERGDDGVTQIALTGAARSFNALAAQSKAFADEKLIKRAIFADIATSDSGVVTFSVTAELDPRLLQFDVEDTPAAAPLPTSTPSTVPAPAATGTPSGASPAATTSAPITL